MAKQSEIKFIITASAGQAKSELDKVVSHLQKIRSSLTQSHLLRISTQDAIQKLGVLMAEARRLRQEISLIFADRSVDAYTAHLNRVINRLHNLGAAAATAVAGIRSLSGAFTGSMRTIAEMVAAMRAMSQYMAALPANVAAQGLMKFGQVLNLVKQNFDVLTVSYRVLNSEMKALPLPKQLTLWQTLSPVLRHVGQSIGDLIGRFRNLIAFMGAFMVIGLIKQLKDIAVQTVQAAVSFEGFQQALAASTGSMQEANRVIAELYKEAQAIGSEFKVLLSSFKNFQAAAVGTSLTTEDLLNVFRGVSRASAVLRLDTQQLTSVMTALEQMLAKGRVQSEELRRQLGNRLPGAFRLAAAGMGMTMEELEKLVRAGQVASDELVVKLAAQLVREYGHAVPEAAEATRAAFNKLKTEAYATAVAVGNELREGVEIAVLALRDLLVLIKKASGTTAFKLLAAQVTIAGNALKVFANSAKTAFSLFFDAADRIESAAQIIAASILFIQEAWLRFGLVNAELTAEQELALRRQIEELSNLRESYIQTARDIQQAIRDKWNPTIKENEQLLLELEEAARRFGQKATEGFEGSAKAAKKLANELRGVDAEQAIGSIEELVKEIDKVAAAQQRGGDEADEYVRRVADAFVRLREDAKKLGVAFTEDVQAAFETMTESLKFLTEEAYVERLHTAIDELIDVLSDAAGAGNEMAAGLISDLERLRDSGESNLNEVLNVIRHWEKEMADAGSEVGNEFSNSLEAAFRDIPKTVGDRVRAASRAIDGFVKSIEDAGDKIDPRVKELALKIKLNFDAAREAIERGVVSSSGMLRHLLKDLGPLLAELDRLGGDIAPALAAALVQLALQLGQVEVKAAELRFAMAKLGIESMDALNPTIEALMDYIKAIRESGNVTKTQAGFILDSLQGILEHIALLPKEQREANKGLVKELKELEDLFKRVWGTMSGEAQKAFSEVSDAFDRLLEKWRELRQERGLEVIPEEALQNAADAYENVTDRVSALKAEIDELRNAEFLSAEETNRLAEAQRELWWATGELEEKHYEYAQAQRAYNLQNQETVKNVWELAQAWREKLAGAMEYIDPLAKRTLNFILSKMDDMYSNGQLTSAAMKEFGDIIGNVLKNSGVTAAEFGLDLDDMSGRVDSAQSKLDEMSSAADKTKESLGGAAANTKEIEKALGGLAKVMEGTDFGTAIHTIGDAMESMKRDAKPAADALSQIKNALIDLSGKRQEIVDALTAIQSKFEELKKSGVVATSKELAETLDKMGGALISVNTSLSTLASQESQITTALQNVGGALKEFATVETVQAYEKLSKAIAALSESLNGMISSLTTLKDNSEALRAAITGVGTAMDAAFSGELAGAVERIATGITIFREAFNGLEEKVRAVTNAIETGLTGAITTASEKLAAFVALLNSYVLPAINTFANSFSETLSSAIKTVIDWLLGVGGLAAAFEQMASRAAGAIASVEAKIDSLIAKIGAAISAINQLKSAANSLENTPGLD